MADAGYLTIGKVVRRLQEQYPDLSISKVRYLEDEGLLTPSRTPGRVPSLFLARHSASRDDPVPAEDEIFAP